MLAALVFALIAVAFLVWAKWWPYTAKLGDLGTTRQWTGASILAAAGEGGGSRWAGAWHFTWAYTAAVWKALVAALVLAAAAEVLLPAPRIAQALAGGARRTGVARGALLSLPTMMCSCCAAPVAVTLRRSGAPMPAVLAFWLGNPLLNPAVVVFLLLVAPPEWGAVRVAAGVLLVLALPPLVARLAGGSTAPPSPPAPVLDLPLRLAPARFLRSLARLSATLVPEFLLAVFAVGAVSGWIESSGTLAATGVVALLGTAAVAALLVVPTAGEIAVIAALAAAGASAGVVGTLLVTLPALSLPSMLMVARGIGWRVAITTYAAVVPAGLAAGGLLAALTA